LTPERQDSVILTDVTLREYGQNVPSGYLHIFTPRVRTRIALELIDAGFTRIEVLSCVPAKTAPAMNIKALKRLAADIGRGERAELVTLVPNQAGYRRFLELALDPGGYNHTMGLFFSAVEAHNLANLGKPVEKSLGEIRTISRDAVSRGIGLVAYVSAAFGYVEPSAGRTYRAEVGKINDYIDELFDLGVQAVTLSDLQGVADSSLTREIWESILRDRSQEEILRLGYHPHHVSARKALAHTEVAFQLGIRRFDASLGGTGGCVTGAPGNQPTEGLLRLFDRRGVSTGIDTRRIFSLGKRVRRSLYNKIPLG